MEYLHHLQKDKQLRPALKTGGPFALKSKGDPYLYLMYSIMSQQLSTKVAEVLKQISHIGGATTDPQLKRSGYAGRIFEKHQFSHAKAGYVHAVAAFSLGGRSKQAKLNRMDDEVISRDPH